MSHDKNVFEKSFYDDWINELSDKYCKSQIKAAVSVNSVMLQYYWDLGKDIHEISLNRKWGNSFFSNLSKDLKNRIPNAKCFSERNLRYMKSFYELFTLNSDNNSILPQLGAELFMIPWGHIKLLVDRAGIVGDDGESHQGLFDVAYLSTIPNVNIYFIIPYESV